MRQDKGMKGVAIGLVTALTLGVAHFIGYVGTSVYVERKDAASFTLMQSLQGASTRVFEAPEDPARALLALGIDLRDPVIRDDFYRRNCRTSFPDYCAREPLRPQEVRYMDWWRAQPLQKQDVPVIPLVAGERYRIPVLK